MDSLLGDCEQPPYTTLQSLTPLSPLMTLNHPLLVSNPIVTSVTTATIVGPEEAYSASYSSSLCLSTRATGPNSQNSLTEPGSSAQEYIRPQWTPLLLLQNPPQLIPLLFIHLLSNILHCKKNVYILFS